MKYFIQIVIGVAIILATFFITKMIYDKPDAPVVENIPAKTIYPGKIDSLEIEISELKSERAKALISKGLLKHRLEEVKRDLNKANSALAVKPDTVYNTIIDTVNFYDYYVSPFTITTPAFTMPLNAYALSPVDSVVTGETVMNDDYLQSVFLKGYESKKNTPGWVWMAGGFVGGALIWSIVR